MEFIRRYVTEEASSWLDESRGNPLWDKEVVCRQRVYQSRIAHGRKFRVSYTSLSRKKVVGKPQKVESTHRVSSSLAMDLRGPENCGRAENGSINKYARRVILFYLLHIVWPRAVSQARTKVEQNNKFKGGLIAKCKLLFRERTASQNRSGPFELRRTDRRGYFHRLFVQVYRILHAHVPFLSYNIFADIAY